MHERQQYHERSGLIPWRQEQERAALQFATEVLQHNVVPARGGKKCVDPRPSVVGDNHGQLATPAADMGDALKLWAMSVIQGWDLSPEACFEMVLRMKQAQNEPFVLHTDVNTGIRGSSRGPNEKPIGCAAVALAANDGVAVGYVMGEASRAGSQDYAQGVVRMIDHAARLKSAGENIAVDVLQGVHDETFVVRNVGVDHSVRQSGLVGVKASYFLHDAARDEQALQRAAEWFSLKPKELQLYTGLHRAQTGAVLANVAYDFPVVSINADQPELSPVLLGRVQ